MCLKTCNYTVIISQLFRDILCKCADLENFTKSKILFCCCLYECPSVSLFLFSKVSVQESEGVLFA